MLSSNRQSPHRRRSQSIASPLTSRRLVEEKWRVAAKRPRPANLRGPSYVELASDQPSQMWDVDRWRKGKRARRDSASPVPSTRGPCLFGSSSVFRNELGPMPSPGLPSTSEAFDFFPSRPGIEPSSSHSTSPVPDSIHDESAARYSGSIADLDKLRSEAFCELQRSIAESGEGLLSRMRDWEQSRSRSPARLFRTPVHDLSPERRREDWTNSAQTCGDEDDDIQIVSGSHLVASTITVPSPSHTRKPRAYSMGDMDIDGPEDIFSPADSDSPQRCCSPFDTTSSALSAYASEDEAPALSFTRTNSSNSLVSLTSHPHPGADAPSAMYSLGAYASRSEKAIAALTLVMANGAGGLNDYEAVRALESPSRASLDESHVGEMWD